MKLLVLCFIFLNQWSQPMASGPLLYFENDSLLIETDTSSLYSLLRKNYSAKRASQIINEVDYRISKNKNDSVLLDYWNIRLYLNDSRTSYEAGCLNYEEVYSLILSHKAQVYYKANGQRIEHFKTKVMGSKRKHLKERVFIDKKNGKVFLKQTLYQRTCSGAANF